ncbi:MAG: ADP-ribosylglycohydrolase family protein [Phycisphaerales bacterium]
MRRNWIVSACMTVGLAAASPVSAQSCRLIDREQYRDRLEGFWLGQCIANWTGRRTEAVRTQPPFLTDADWGPPFNGGAPLDWVTNQSPWLADDDTDIEYVYLHATDQASRALLSGAEIRDQWVTHINRFIWVSNASSRALMTRGVTPPVTSLAEANPNRLMIDAQLTTEFFGLFAPGMPEAALTLADLPIRTTASGHAAHASQVYVLLYAIDQTLPADLSGRARNLRLLGEARRFIPDTSKAADIIDVCTADYLANPDINDWERTRDLACERYQTHPEASAFRYRAWYESSVNFAAGVIALLYGEGDYRRTVQIATLAGWDSDNATSTLGGLLGMRLGRHGLEAAFSGRTLATTYRWSVTRDALVDYVDGPGEAEDTFSLMAERMLPLVEQTIIEAGGLVDPQTERWLVSPAPAGDWLDRSPTHREWMASANGRVLAAGGVLSATSNAIGSPPTGAGLSTPSAFANGLEHDFGGREEIDQQRRYFSSFGSPATGEVILTVIYDRPVTAARLRFIEGDHFASPSMTGGWTESPTFEARVDGAWTALSGDWSELPDAAVPFQRLDWVLDVPATVTGVRWRGAPGGTHRFVTCSELDVIDAISAPRLPSFDIDDNGVVHSDDLHAWHANPADLDGDGAVTASDLQLLMTAVRWREPAAMMSGR